MNATPQFVYPTFGADIDQHEAVLSIASELAHSALCASDRQFEIQAFTDSPQCYTRPSITTCTIDPNWDGPHRYHFRFKHAVLLNGLSEYEKAVRLTLTRFSVPLLLPVVICSAVLSELLSENHHRFPASHLEQTGLLDTNVSQTNAGETGLITTDKGVLEHSINMGATTIPTNLIRPAQLPGGTKL